MGEAVVAREEALERIRRSVVDVHALPAAMVLEGEAGIGKTALWRAGIEMAEAAGFLVLRATPSEAETQLAFAAAADLLAPVGDDALRNLPDVQRRALAGAVFLEGPGVADRRAVATAFLGALRHLAAAAPVLVAADDTQWLDADSALLLSFAVRRLTSEPIGFLLARRPQGDKPQVDLGEAVERLQIEPLSLSALGRLIHARLGAPIARPLLRRIHEVSGGNPFFALELAAAADRNAAVHDVALPESLEGLVDARLRRLTPETRAALAELAAMPDLPRDDTDSNLLAPAIDAGVLRLTAEGREFVHPLLRAAAYAQLSTSRRRELHRQLADAAGDAEQRAHHLARAADQADERAAAEIEQGAWQAKRRGAPAVAAELLGHASRLTENEERRARRVMRAASWNAEAGELDSARAAVEALLGDLVPGPLRAEALATLADDVGVPIDRAVTLAEEGLAQPGLAAATRARLLLALSDTVFLQNDIRGSAEYAREGLAVAESDADEELLTRATSWNGQLASLTATADPASFFERARRLEERLPALDPWRAAGHWHGVSLMWGDRLSEARPLLEEQYERSLELGNEFARAGLCFHLAQLECRAGKYAQANRYAREGQELASLSGNRQLEGLVLNAGALVAAHEGDALGARSLAGEALAATGDAGDAFFVIHHRVVLGFVEASLPDYAAARRHLDGLPELLEEMGVLEPGIFPHQGDTIEALISLGEPDEVERMLDALEKQGSALDRPRLLALVWRGRGLLYAAGGDAAKAEDAFTRALAEHERLELPLERARTLLAQGVALRRARQKRSAREALEAAAAIFNDVGAGLWSERARTEISRVGGRAPSGGALTATELQVAKLAAAGRANKEIAAELHVTVRTVETHLTKVYEKLGIRRRGELAHRLTA